MAFNSDRGGTVGRVETTVGKNKRSPNETPHARNQLKYRHQKEVDGQKQYPYQQTAQRTPLAHFQQFPLRNHEMSIESLQNTDIFHAHKPPPVTFSAPSSSYLILADDFLDFQVVATETVKNGFFWGDRRFSFAGPVKASKPNRSAPLKPADFFLRVPRKRVEWPLNRQRFGGTRLGFWQSRTTEFSAGSPAFRKPKNGNEFRQDPSNVFLWVAEPVSQTPGRRQEYFSIFSWPNFFGLPVRSIAICNWELVLGMRRFCRCG